MKRLVTRIIGLYALFVLPRAIWRGVSARRRLPSEPPQLDRLPFVSIVIPAWRDCDALETCLRTLSQVDYPDYEVIVVAGGPDGTHAAALAAAQRDGHIQVLEQLPRGKNAALNQGLAVASADVVVFLDADSELTPQWLKGLVGALQGDVVASTGNYLPLRETPVSLTGDMAKVYEYQVRHRIILQGSGGIAVRRDALEAIGPFPEERVSSDWDLDARLGLQGYRKVFAPHAVIRSHRPATVSEWWRNELRWRRLHLRSLLRLKGELLNEPVPAAQHVFPYVTAWSIGLLSVIAAGSLSFKTKAVRESAFLTWGGFAWLLFLRELSPVLSVMAYHPSMRWLPVIATTPLTTVFTWGACIVASLTRDRAALQFKGVRHRPGTST